MKFFLVELIGLQLDLEIFSTIYFLLLDFDFFLFELFGLQLELEKIFL